jgi:hypothetical protein
MEEETAGAIYGVAFVGLTSERDQWSPFYLRLLFLSHFQNARGAMSASISLPQPSLCEIWWRKRFADVRDVVHEWYTSDDAKAFRERLWRDYQALPERTQHDIAIDVVGTDTRTGKRVTVAEAYRAYWKLGHTEFAFASPSDVDSKTGRQMFPIFHKMLAIDFNVFHIVAVHAKFSARYIDAAESPTDHWRVIRHHYTDYSAYTESMRQAQDAIHVLHLQTGSKRINKDPLTIIASMLVQDAAELVYLHDVPGSKRKVNV